jgi:hypothetical protein
LLDTYHKEGVFVDDDDDDSHDAKIENPPVNTISLRSRLNLTASSLISGFASPYASTIAKTASLNPTATFTDFWELFKSQIKNDQAINVISNPGNLFNSTFIATLQQTEHELQVSAITPQLLGQSVESLPPPDEEDDLTKVEIEQAQKRWDQFVAEMKKPANYTSKYKKYLQQLDAMGCINLERIKRDQIPDIRIDRCISLFFCPYEGLPHTLDLGPVNDAVTMATLFISLGYKVVYLCDATPKEYYTWMDWLLENVYYEVVSYFSGHGTQTKDTTGKEKDGLSEVLVFYDESRKSGGKATKINAVTGITEQTVSDDTMHDLILEKDYPETRIVLISDCCHSGTSFL